MRKVQLLLVACFTVFSVSVMAQQMDYQTHETLAKSITDKMKRELSLTSDQEAKLKTINENYTKNIYDLKKQYPNDMAELNRRVVNSGSDYDAEVRKVLNDNQYSTYVQKKSDMAVDVNKIRHDMKVKKNNNM